MVRLIGTTTAILMLAACASNNDAISESGSQLQVRQMQTREYGFLNKRDTLRSILATLQDLGFVIDKADYEMATITATKLQEYQVRMTVTVRERGSEQLAVRANARINESAVEEPRIYQNFFVALDKAMFLTQQNVD